MDFSGPTFPLALHVRSTYFIVTSMSPHSGAFLKAYSDQEQPHRPWQYLGTCSVLVNCWVVCNGTSILSSEPYSFSLDLGNSFASFSIEALDLHPDNIGRRKRKGWFRTFHGSHKDQELNSWVGQTYQWEFPRLTVHPIHRRNGCILLFPAHNLLCLPPS